MAPETNPCAQGLTSQCFKAYPDWARKAFSYRLMNMLTPPAISRRLQKLLKGAWVFPGIIVAPDLVPPPGTVILPAPGPPPVGLPGEIPTGDQVPPPIDWNNPPAGSPLPSPFLEPFQPGPIGGSRTSPPSGGFVEFIEPWASIDPAIWTVDQPTRTVWSIVAGWLKSDWSAGGPGTYLYHDMAEAIPANYSIKIKVRADSGTSNFVLSFYTGSNLISITFAANPSLNSVYLIDGSTIGTNNKVGDENVWTLIVTASGWDLYLGVPLIATNTSFTASTDTPGRVHLLSNPDCYESIDYLEIKKA